MPDENNANHDNDEIGVYPLPENDHSLTEIIRGGLRFDGQRERDRLLAEAGRLISGDREDVYGSAIDGFSRTGQLWAAILGLDVVTAEQVALCLAALKISRLAHDTGHRDSWLDLIGYAALGGDIADETAKDTRTA